MLRLLVLLFACSVPGFAHLNLYMSEQQVKTHMGVSAEVYYVKDGIVNTYAINFVLNIQANISNIMFIWHSQHPLNYVWTVDYHRTDAMLGPELSIPSKGSVPKEATPFKVVFPCTGRRSAEIAVALHLNVSGPSHPPIQLSLRRNKICLKGNSTWESPRNMSLGPDASPVGGPASLPIYLAAGSASLLVLVVFKAVTYMKRRKSASQTSTHTSYSYGTSGAYLGNPNVLVRFDSGSYASIESCRKDDSPVSPYATTYLTTDLTGANPTHHIYSNPQSVVSYSTSHVSERSRVVELGRDALRTGRIMYEGSYARVLTTTNLLGPKLMVKTVSERATQLQATQLLCEGTRLSSLIHENLLPVLAASAEPVPMVIYPAFANLKMELLGCRRGERPATQELLAMGLQLGRALLHLHSQGVLHRDVAARNCYVEGRRAVLGDSALARDFFPEEYCRLGGSGEGRPLRWLPPEELSSISAPAPAADVWMFGVLLWELVTLGETPYRDVEVSRLADHLALGARLEQPLACPDHLYGVMQCCWVEEAGRRPSIAQLLSCLLDFATALGPYV